MWVQFPSATPILNTMFKSIKEASKWIEENAMNDLTFATNDQKFKDQIKGTNFIDELLELEFEKRGLNIEKSEMFIGDFENKIDNLNQTKNEIRESVLNSLKG